MTGRKYSLLAKLELARRLSALDQSRFSISPMCSNRVSPRVKGCQQRAIGGDTGCVYLREIHLD